MAAALDYQTPNTNPPVPPPQSHIRPPIMSPTRDPSIPVQSVGVVLPVQGAPPPSPQEQGIITPVPEYKSEVIVPPPNPKALLRAHADPRVNAAEVTAAKRPVSPVPSVQSQPVPTDPPNNALIPLLLLGGIILVVFSRQK